jgi:tetraacyldisaccharide 4'-kinase
MKAPGFWYDSPGLCSYLLWPLSLFWRAGTAARHIFARPYRARIPMICIGNVVTGGAGKTPMALALAHLLQQAGKQPVFVTRGYGGTKTGPDRVDLDRHSALDVGDEALLLAGTAHTFFGRNRAQAVQAAEKHSRPTHILLDDGLQNPHLQPDISFLVIDGDSGIGNGFVMPAGPLRETLGSAAKRVDAVVIVGDSDRQNIAARLRCPVIRAHWQPQISADFPRTEKFVAFAGIGRPEKFYATCRKAGLDLAATMDFPDHHYYTDRELSRLRSRAAAEGARLLTTEKDWVRLPLNARVQTLALPAKLVFEDEATIKRLLGV